MNDHKQRLYVIGFGRCGTTSLHVFFKKSGLRSIHWDEGKLSERIINNIKRGVHPVEGYEEYDVFSDAIEAFKYFHYIVKFDPNAKFILNVRDISRWVGSCMGWPTYNRYHYMGNMDTDNISTFLRTQWHAHIASVKHSIPPDRLLVFDIEKDDPTLLCDFLGLPRKFAKFYSQYNRSLRKLNPIDRILRSVWRISKIFIPRNLRPTVRSTYTINGEIINRWGR